MSGTHQEQHIPIDDLSAYLDGMIEDPEEERRIREHLSGCSVCRDELRQLNTVTQLLAELPEPEVPRSFRLSESDVPSRDNAPTPIEPWFIRYQSRFQAAAMAAVLVLAVVAAVDFWPESNQIGSQEAADAPVAMEAPQEEAARDAPADDAADGAGESGGTDGQAQPESGDAAAGAEEEGGGDESAGAGSDSGEDASTEAFSDTAVESEEDAATDDSGASSAGESEDSDQDAAMESESDRAGAEQPEGQQQVLAESDEGISTLRIAMIVLGVVGVALLIVGFVIPRWWGSSARGS